MDDPEVHSFLNLINALRSAHGLASLSASAALDEVAYAHALDMGRRVYFGHTDLAGRSPFDRPATVFGDLVT